MATTSLLVYIIPGLRMSARLRLVAEAISGPTDTDRLLLGRNSDQPEARKSRV